jgi:acyl transferase domain-containing protein
VNSFGFGGTNAHVVLDDAFHYLASKGLRGNHCTRATLSEPLSSSPNRVSGALLGHPLNLVLRLQEANNIQDVCGSHEVKNPEEKVNVINKLNGEVTNSSQTLIDGSGFNSINDSSGFGEPNDTRKADGMHQSDNTLIAAPDIHNPRSDDIRLLVFSASDENALKRTIQQLLPYYREHILGNRSALERLARILSSRRSNLLWRSYAIADPGDTDVEVDLQVAKQQRSASSKQTGIAFVFTGQGAEYARMGFELLQFPVFRQTLEKMEDIFAGLGCSWSLIGMSSNGDLYSGLSLRKFQGNCRTSNLSTNPSTTNLFAQPFRLDSLSC